jgi:hypothetical protein
VLSFVILGQLWLAHHRIFGVIARVDYSVLVRNLVFLGLIAIMPFPVRLLSDYTRRPLAVAIYAVAFITAMQLQRLIWLDVTRPEHRDLLREPVPDEVRTGFGRVLLGLLVVFGAAVPVGMFAPGTRPWCGRSSSRCGWSWPGSPTGHHGGRPESSGPSLRRFDS